MAELAQKVRELVVAHLRKVLSAAPNPVVEINEAASNPEQGKVAVIIKVPVWRWDASFDLDVAELEESDGR